MKARDSRLRCLPPSLPLSGLCNSYMRDIAWGRRGHRGQASAPTEVHLVTASQYTETEGPEFKNTDGRQVKGPESKIIIQQTFDASYQKMKS